MWQRLRSTRFLIPEAQIGFFNSVSSSLTLDGPVQASIHEALKAGETITLHVNGNCMDPHLQNSDPVKVSIPGRYVPGDVVAYYCPHSKASLVHRFLGYVRINGVSKFLIMADSAEKPDVLVEPFNVFGKVVARYDVPFQASFPGRLQAIVLYGYWVLRLGLKKFSR